MTDKQPTKAEMELGASILGIPLSAIALVSLLHKVFKVGLAPVLNGVVALWRDITAPFTGVLKWLLSFIHVQLPEWYIDTYILSFIVGVIVFKNVFIYFEGMSSSQEGAVIIVRSWLISAIFSLPILFNPLLVLSALYSERKGDEETVEKFNRTAEGLKRDLIAVISLAIVFFTANAVIR